MAHLRPRDFDSVKQYSAELLVALLGQDANRRKLGEAGGIDMLLQGVAYYKSREPKTMDEGEFLENLFDALCSCLLLPENRVRFMESEGIELMLLILKQKKHAKYGAVKVLEFATTNCPAACDRFVDVLGLKTIFSLFMGKSKIPSKDRETRHKIEEHLVTIIAHLFHETSARSKRDRVAAKFVENEFEKCDRLIELYFGCQTRLLSEEAQVKELVEEADEEEALAVQLNFGLGTMQQVCLIIAHLWCMGDVALRQRLLLLLHQKGHTLGNVRYGNGFETENF
eukprot:evm.model.scf_992.3 EVM.evm.TU.scf_992.3   scf_992:15874-19979(-)